MSAENTVSTTPFVSVVIPAHNEADYIADCIQSVFSAGHPRERLEVLVVDHASSDATRAIALRAGASVLALDAGRIGKVRNTGLAAARGDYVAYVDADCIVPSTWLKSAVALLEADPKNGAVGGPCLSPKDGNWIENALAPSTVTNGITKSATALATSSLITRAGLLKAIGGFDETLISGEDDDLSNRIRNRGFTLQWASDCHIVHRGYPRTLWGVVKKETWHGSNHIDVRSGLDLTLILTIAFLLATAGVLAFTCAVFPYPSATISTGLGLSILAQITPPMLYAIKRVKQWPRDWYLLPRFALVGYGYFLGHGVGVLSNVWRKLRKWPPG